MFQFCNLLTFAKEDDEEIKNYALDQTTKNGGNATATEQQSTEQIMHEFHLVPCVFPRDALFSIVVAKAGEGGFL